MNEAVHVNLPGADVPVEGVGWVEVAGRIREGQSSSGYVGGALDIGGAAGEFGVEGDVPGPAGVVGVGLGVVMTVGCDVGPDGANDDGFVFEGVLPVELDAAIAEVADIAGIGSAHFVVGEGLGPLVRFGVVEEERHAFPVAVGPVSFDLFEFRFAVPDGAHGDGAVEVDGRG